MKQIFSITAILLLGMVFFISSCKEKETLDIDKMHVYKADQLQKIVDNAFKIEKVGQPTVKTYMADSAGTMTTTRTQVYKVFVGLDKEGKIVPAAQVSESARMNNNDPIIITSACQMTCTPVRPGEPCNVSGCEETERCGCSQGSCGNNCTTDVMCHQSTFSGFGFGRLIIF